MKKIAIRMLVVALCLTMGMFAVGCGTDNETPAGDSDVETENVSGTITISLIESNKPGMTPLIEDFEKAYPDIKVEAEFISDLNAYYSQLPTRMAAGNGPDLVYMIPGSASPCGVARFAEAGYLLDLSDQPWVSDMYEPTKPIMMYDDAVVAKDIGFTPLADMLYNKDYFEANNLEIPETFDELVALCKQIRALDDGVTPISWGAGDPAVNHNDVASMSVNTVFSANPDWLQDRKDGKTTFATTEGWRTTLTQLQELIEIGAFSPGAAGVNFSQMSAEFGNGQTAMAFTAGVMAGMAMSVDPDLNIGQFAYPGVTADDTRFVLTVQGGVGVNVQSENQEAAKLFLEFWSLPEEGKVFTDASTLISANEASTGELSGTYTGLSPLFTGGKVIPDPTASWPNTSFKTNAGSSIQGLFTGQKTVDQVLADLDTYFEAE